jgi:hypothetical protein
VRPWWPRWRPYTPDGRPELLYVAATCPACSQIGAWLAARKPAGLRLVPAETLEGAATGTGVRRLTYVAADGHSEQGLAAFARALEHVHLGWALLAWVLRLPGVGRFAQLVADAVGAGPRELDPAKPWRAPWAS